MKNLFKLLVFIVLFGVGHLSAQSLGSIGVKGGLNFAGAQGEDIEAFQDWKQGYMGGVFLSIKLGRGVGIRPEAMYTQKGYEWSTTIGGEEVLHSINLNYVDIPVFLVLSPVKFLQVFGGPAFGYFIDGQTTISFSDGSVQQDISSDLDPEDIQEPEISAALGAALVLGSVSLEARYMEGRTHIWSENADVTEPGRKSANVQLLFGVRF
jgi:hypothetical protein